MTEQTQISTTYSPADAEKKWYKAWEKGQYFKPKKGKANKEIVKELSKIFSHKPPPPPKR